MQLRIVALQTLAVGLMLGPLICPMNAQWVNYPTAGVPRTQDGKPDLAAACPRTADGKPDFSGLWVMQTKREGNPDFPGCEPVSDEFVNIAASLKDGLPYQTWAADLVKARRTEQRVNDPMSRCSPIGPVRLHTWNGPRKVVQNPGLLVLMSELEPATGRSLPMDARCRRIRIHRGTATPAASGKATRWWCRRTVSATACGWTQPAIR